MPKRRRRTEATSANRQAVLRVARQEFERNGYHGAVLARIADAAGFSEGVVYSQFGSKVDLFLAVLEASIDDRANAFDDAAGGARGPEQLHRIAQAQSLATIAWQAALIEFRVHASRHPDVNARYRTLHEQAIDNVAGVVAAASGATGVEPRQLAQALTAETTGICLEVLADPTLDSWALSRALGRAALVEHRDPVP